MKFISSFFLFAYPLQLALHILLGKNKNFRSQFKYEREIFKFKDGGIIAIDWIDEISKPNDKRPILVVTPGLGGDFDTIYVVGTIYQALKQGYCPVIISLRGTSGLKLSNSILWCASSSNDIKEPLEYIYNKYCLNEKKEKVRQIFYFGISFSGNILAHYVGTKSQENTILDGAAAICSPHRIWIVQETFYSNLWGMVEKYMLKKLKALYTQNTEVLRSHVLESLNIDLDKYLKEKNQCDDYNDLTAKLNGYKDKYEYYDKASISRIVENIKVPMFFLNSLDDPVTGYKHIDYETFTSNPYILLGITERGGHVSHFENIITKEMWFPKPALEFFNSFRKDL
ncbi:alpha beta hydrolase domain containing protein [Stylonychia lemnae]|uniref:Alpha beta hydrolase domain containing protein n=1 Tax=Stylonychia lemnae TaxID=5949 RepID=A0A078AAB7_STYLE|nr:alpha beta hydrolase domain containing protein [Stylonychia lemnae]|eukprot:CDW78532.1 alpha beta hydrolase domain containing protein [Stylonychia lemnae]